MSLFALTSLFTVSARRGLTGLLLGWVLLWPSAAPAGEASGGEETPRLLKVVALARHGVRTPTQHRNVLESWTMRAWPVWPVWTPPGLEDPRPDAPGRLTERGARLVNAFWRQQRRSLNDAALLPATECPDPTRVFVYADLDERTRATAQALLEGLAPACGLRYATAPGRDPLDPLFHPVRAGIASLDAAAAARHIQAAHGPDLSGLARELDGPLRALADIAGPLPPQVRRAARLPKDATLADLPTTLRVSADNRAVHVEGGLGIAAAMAEIFLLEYAQWPGKAAGWGRVNATVLERLLPLHVRVSNAVNRNPGVARAGGGALLAAMSAALNGTHPDPRANAARLVVFVGHDTNIAQVGGLLGLEWHVPGYAPRQAPPAGILALSLWRGDAGEYVRAHFVAQPLAALHAANPEAGEAVSVEIAVPRCPAAPGTGFCSRQRFVEVTRAALAASGTADPKSPDRP